MNIQNVKTEVTINELARMVQRGFKEQSDELKEFKIEVHDEFGKVQKEFGAIHEELDDIHEELDEIHDELDDVHEDLGGVHKDIKEIRRDMATKDDVAELTSHINATDKTVYKEHAPKIRRLENASA